MSPDILEAASGETFEATSFTAPSSYTSGGYQHTSDLGRVDEAIAEIRSGSLDAHVASVSSDNTAHIRLFSSDTAVEVPDDDTSADGDTITVISHRL